MHEATGAARVLDDAAAEAHLVHALRAGDLPGATVLEPLIGRLLLHAAHDVLPENAVVVAQAVAHARDAERGHRIQKAGREPAQAAVAQACVRLLIEHLLQVDAELGQRGARFFQHTQIDQAVFQQAPDQKFERQVVDDFRLLALALLPSARPTIEHPIASQAGRRDEVIELRGRARVLTERVLHVIDEAVANRVRVQREFVDGDVVLG